MKDLNDEQKDAAIFLGNVVLQAFPGSGKTRTLIARARLNLDLIAEFRGLALVTFSNAAADEINHRLGNTENVFVGTIHAFCLEHILRPFSWLEGWCRPQVISIEQKQEFLEIFQQKTDTTLAGRDLTIENLDKVKKDLGGNLIIDVSFKNPNVSVQDFGFLYLEFLAERNLIDFNGILYRSYCLLRDHRFVATAVGAKYAEFLVDEFQDTTPIQYQILKHVNEAGQSSFFFVGDKYQSIMSFAGAKPEIFDDAKKDFNCEPMTLPKTYRSSDSIVDSYAAIFPENAIIDNSESPNKDNPHQVFFGKYENEYSGWNPSVFENTNVPLIRKTIHWLKSKGFKENEIAILSPWWNDCFDLAKGLRNSFPMSGFGALPHKTRGYRTAEFDLLKSVSLFVVEPNFKHLRFFSRSTDQLLLENGESEDKLSPTDRNRILGDILRIPLSNPIDFGMNKIQEIVKKEMGLETPTVEFFRSQIAENNASDWTFEKYLHALHGTKGIVNINMHSSKGLEFEAVILNQVNNRRLPFWDMEEDFSPKSYRDAQHLLYVASSRAKKIQFVFSCKKAVSPLVKLIRPSK